MSAAFPDTQFALTHIGYPYQEEFIALAKHYPNVAIDIGWAWSVNPAAGVRFLKDFLLSVPAEKIFTFGGGYMAVELIYGHACLARRGIAQAVSELVNEGWIAHEETPDLIERIMPGNALRFFPNQRPSAAQEHRAGTASTQAIRT
ncbi:amidohydrolase family protein [Bradyrhizobium sp. 141]|uniref:amidohydrolase family protein n=1 Tax=Bradyrhizobium sp. 141 TaxID=2782617 RepID=UPI001FF95F27|nr:amidohydrolase family protein [Bradyrhizobium sp. 141]MCK1717562.1 amidohydrolase family protein [Bradyrhizobium sp. 141]